MPICELFLAAREIFTNTAAVGMKIQTLLLLQGTFCIHLPKKWLQDTFTGWELGSPVPPLFPPLPDKPTCNLERL